MRQFGESVGRCAQSNPHRGNDKTLGYRSEQSISLITKWLRVETRGGDPWVIPIWSAINQAVEAGRVALVGDEVRQLALHLSTRLTMLPRIFKRINKECYSLYASIATRQPHHECTRTHDGYAFPLDDELKYNLLLDIDSLLFEVNSCCELITTFFTLLHQHRGQSIPKDQVGKKIRRILDAGQDPTWFVQLDTHRNFFMHEGAPYIAIDLSNEVDGRYDLLIMKENMGDFSNSDKFIRLSELSTIVNGFELSKPLIQQYLVNLFA